MKPLLLVCAFLTVSCATQRQNIKSVNGISEISFGKGGGFTGLTEEYLLTGKAEVFKIVNGEQTLLNQITKPQIKSITGQINDLQFQDLKTAETGNMTYFIQVSAKKYKNRVTWSDTTDVPQLKELYKTLVKTLKIQ